MCFKSLLSAKIVLIIFIIIGLAIFVLCWYAMFQVEQEFELRQDVLSAVKVKDAATSIVMQNYLTETEAMRYLADPSEKKFQTYLTDFLLGKDKIEDFFLNVKMYNNVVYGGGEDIIENMKSQDESINEIIAMLKNFGADYANQEKSGAIKAGLLEIDAELAKSRVNENMRTFAQKQNEYFIQLSNNVSRIESNIRISVVILLFVYLFLLIISAIGIINAINLVKAKIK